MIGSISRPKRFRFSTVTTRAIDMTSGTDQVVLHHGGPLLVLGGPGSGKTAALEGRYLHLAAREDLAPHRILFMCTSRGYATEAKDRLVWALPHKATREVPVYTWHALAYHLVSRYYPLLGYHEAPVLLTAPEQWGVVRELLAHEDRKHWPVWSERLTERGFIDEIADFCLRVEQRLISSDDLAALGTHREDWSEVIAFYGRYRDYLKQQSRLDYAGLISSAVDLLVERTDVAEALKRRFPHVLVDDGQELSRAHLSLLQKLSTDHLVVAADPESGIETFRGAEPDWVYGFGSWFGDHSRMKLEGSHRVGSGMWESAARLISHNDPESAPVVGLPASHPTIAEARMYTSLAEEVDSIARELRKLHLVDGVSWERMAVLVSQPRFLLPPLERALERWEVPYDPMSGDRPIASEPSVASFLDLVRVSLGVEGSGELLPNLLTSPLIGLDFAERRRIERLAWQERTTLRELVEEMPEVQEFRRLRDLVVANSTQADECFWHVFSASAYFQRVLAAATGKPDGPEAAELDALVAFSHSLGRFVERRHGRGSIDDYLSEAARADFGGDPWLPTAASARGGKVALASFHSAKGREWHTVIVAGCLDAWIPKGRRAQGLFDPFALEISDIADREVEAIADDRRTFYVAATRASERTLFTVSPGPSGRGRPTRFFSELGVELQELFESPQLPPLTLAEMRSRLRKQLIDKTVEPAGRVAAVLALAEIPDTDPMRWYGRWDWTDGSVPLVEEGILNTSYSRLGVYENCGLQYVLQSVLGLDPASTHSMKFGTWIHALFQAVHEGKINDIPTLKQQYRLLFDDAIFPNKAMAEQFRRDGENMLRRFWETEFTQENVLTEHSFNFPFHGANLRGRIDRIDHKAGNLKLTDYKTARWAPSRQEAEKSLQLAIYFLAARTDPELVAMGEPQQARLVYPGSTWPDGRLKELPQNAEQAEKVIATLPELIDGVKNEDFKPSPDANCFFCKMKPLCPLWPEGREVQS